LFAIAVVKAARVFGPNTPSAPFGPKSALYFVFKISWILVTNVFLSIVVAAVGTVVDAAGAAVPAGVAVPAAATTEGACSLMTLALL
jgi:hypothetical protein